MFSTSGIRALSWEKMEELSFSFFFIFFFVDFQVKK